MRRTPIVAALLVLGGPQSLAHGPLHEQIGVLDRQIAAAPTQAILYMQRGELHREHGDVPAALTDYDRAARLAPDRAEVDLMRARALLQGSQARRALSYVDRFLTRHADHGAAHLLRARSLDRLGDRKAALDAYDRALAHLPTPGPDEYLERARLAQTMGLPDRALASLDEGTRRLGPIVSLELPAIEIESQRRGWDAALARLDRLTAQAPRKETWLQRRGELLLKAGRTDEAAQAFRDTLAALAALPPVLRATRAMDDLEKRAKSGVTSCRSAPPHSPRRRRD